MFDVLKFKCAVLLSGLTMADVINHLGISETTFYRKLNRGGDFRRSEIQILKEILKVDDTDSIFFASKLTKTQGDDNNANA